MTILDGLKWLHEAKKLREASWNGERYTIGVDESQELTKPNYIQPYEYAALLGVYYTCSKNIENWLIDAGESVELLPNRYAELINKQQVSNKPIKKEDKQIKTNSDTSKMSSDDFDKLFKF